MTTRRSANRNAYNNNNGSSKQSDDHVDNVSALSDDQQTSGSKLSVWEQTKLILVGVNPNEVDADNNNGQQEDLVGRSFEGSHHSSKKVEFKDDEVNNHGNSIRKSKGESDLHYSSRSSNGDLNGSALSTEALNFLQDPYNEMTFGRRIALFLSRRYSSYNPHLNKPKLDNNTELQQLQPDIDVTESPSPDILKSFSNESGIVILTEENKADLILNDAYPFTMSVREQPSLERAWVYFEHVAMPRYIVKPKEDAPKKNICMRFIRKCFMKGNKQLQRAEPGEDNVKTALYHPMFTPHKQLGDFGLGIGLYFSTLRAIMVLTLLAGILNTANFLYFSSDEYNNPLNPSVVSATLLKMVVGSAICTDTSWVLCNDGSCSSNTDAFPGRIGIGTNTITNQNATFVLQNNCIGATIQQGMISYATLLFIMIGTIILNVYLTRMEVAFDEDEQTAQDYSILIANPPHDAKDPQEWHDYFKKAFDAHVTACTVAVDNDLLVRTLVKRREILRRIELAVEPGTPLDTLSIARIAAKIERERRLTARLLASFFPDIPEFFSQLTVMTAKVQGLAQLSYPVTNVFVSFETERSQREVLEAFNLGSIDVKSNDHSKMKYPDKHLFRGNLVLKVVEPDEPNTVRWSDLNEKFKERMKQQFLTFLCTVAAIALIVFIVHVIDNGDLSKAATAYTISIFNFVFPQFAKALTRLEAHASESEIQRSLYFKIAAFRWVNTAIVITLITPFTASLENNALINQVYALFLADISTTAAIQLSDPWGHVQRHILAPRAKTQDAMNLLMQGAEFELAERYTAMTKLLFLAFWYCAIYPNVLYLCSLALLVMYFIDRFSLMRTWKRAPHLGSNISMVSRQYFFSLAIVALALVSSYYWASFPFDNICETSATVPTTETGTWTVDVIKSSNDVEEHTTYQVVLTEDDNQYKYCIQDFMRYPKGYPPFPFVPKNQIPGSEWMTDDQEIVTNIYGWSAIGVMCIVLFSFFWKGYLMFMTLFRGTYEPCGDDMEINFSDVPSINTYVPQVESNVFSYPLLACNIDNIDPSLLEWTDPDKPHSFYDLTKDAEVLLRGKEFGNNVVFSQIAHWPPPGKDRRKQGIRRSLMS